MKLGADLHDLVGEVLSQIPRLLALQDRDPDSPMRGCFHPAYWRDKSSDVADMRRQEATLALAWVWRHPFPGNVWQGSRDVLHACLRGLGFWTRQQHKDGTFDEWYKNEHGYATTAFSSYAVALCVEALGDALEDPLRSAVLQSLRRSGGWLATHDDWFKTNHEAVGVAALGAVGRLLGAEDLLKAARRNAAAIVERMQPEGWSREISGADLGYTFLLAEYLAMHAVLTGDRTWLPPVQRAFRFATEFLHPDLTTGAEYGICGNPYFSRVAAAALAPHDAMARAVLEWMERELPGPRDTSPTLKDDLRLARYAYQPLLAALLAAGVWERRDIENLSSTDETEILPFLREAGESWFPGAGLLAVRRPAYVAWVAPCYGGLVRVAFRDGTGGFHRPTVDRGYMVESGARFRSARYDIQHHARFEHGSLELTTPLARTRFVMPPYLARVGLRVATSLPAGPRWSRWMIDQWRKRKGTALNQSSAGISGGKSIYRLHRRVAFHEDRVEIHDRLEGDQPLPPTGLFHVIDPPDAVADGVRPDPDRRIPADPLGPDPHRFEVRRAVGPKPHHIQRLP